MEPKGKIVAIGGGEIGRHGFPVETTKIDKEIIKLTGKKNPKLLFIPTASNDSESYYEVVKKHFGQNLKCKTDVLYLIKNKITKKQIKDRILGSDIIYVGGGNTRKMIEVWKKTGADEIFKEAYKRGIVLSGLSAGSICWFKYGNSDSGKMIDPKANYVKISGLGFINALYCPHYDFEKDRPESLKNMMKKESGVAIAIDNCCALEIVGDKYRVISSKFTANAYKVFWKNNEFFEEKIKKSKNYALVSELLLL